MADRRADSLDAGQQQLGVEMTDTQTEALRLEAFAKYKPRYYWQEIKAADVFGENSDWRILAEADIEGSDESHFLGVMDKWIQEAELVIPPVEKTEILDSNAGIPETPDGRKAQEEHIVRRVRRVLHPKRKSKDAALEENVVVCRAGDNGVYARFIPAVSDPSGIPFYYPKVTEFAFGYVDLEDAGQHGGDGGETAAVLVVLVREQSPGSTTATKKQCLIWQDLIKRLYKWTATEKFGYQKRVIHDVVVSYDAYTSKYQELKARYAQHWVDNWPEQTDPRKFVYEDIAIASWIICLWEQDREWQHKKPSFVDLGCGNGLLVHFLNSEGFSGYGIDQCSRKIWKCFGGNVDLRAETLAPHEFVTDADWIIGNHADELVPWIPVIAARSRTEGFSPGFIAIPCCPHDLSGRKMAFPASAGQSKYQMYVRYVEELARKSGFGVQKEFLRIPSTKNVAIVGRGEAGSLIADRFVEELAQRGEHEFVARTPDSVKNEVRMEKMRQRQKKTLDQDKNCL
ncbi:tRNA(Ser) Um(44) 2'-O-methyltransferase [Coemansia sp. RSA 2599]|nr:tRNA(Ser) Um(44) 2'-O-methyltransferase [Coemansia sp. RSA 2599]